MQLSRRAALCGLGGAGFALVAGQAFAEDAPQTAVSAAGWSGVVLTLSGQVAQVTNLDPYGPAARAGLRVGDLVTGWSGGQLNALPAALSGAPGDRLDLTVTRDGKARGVCVILEAAENARP